MSAPAPRWATTPSRPTRSRRSLANSIRSPFISTRRQLRGLISGRCVRRGGTRPPFACATSWRTANAVRPSCAAAASRWRRPARRRACARSQMAEARLCGRHHRVRPGDRGIAHRRQSPRRGPAYRAQHQHQPARRACLFGPEQHLHRAAQNVALVARMERKCNPEKPRRKNHAMASRPFALINASSLREGPEGFF